MVYIHFPTNLTEEEIMLQTKYQKLKKKKKALISHKAPKQEQEKAPPNKRPIEAKEAKEVAKKLIKSGVISAIPKSERQERTTFKRSKGLERKLSGADKALTGYTPFSAMHPEEQPQEATPKVKNLYESFVSARDREERGLSENPEGRVHYKPRQGNTLYVFGYNVSEEILKRAFSPYGNIINISMEIEKNCGFVTFDKVECADRAVSEMNGCMVSGIQLKVSFARRQPIIEPINDATSSATWSTLAASHSQKGSHRDKRDLVMYEDDLF